MVAILYRYMLLFTCIAISELISIIEKAINMQHLRFATAGKSLEKEYKRHEGKIRSSI